MAAPLFESLPALSFIAGKPCSHSESFAHKVVPDLMIVIDRQRPLPVVFLWAPISALNTSPKLGDTGLGW
ncbi:hypothetical protein [Pseudomonas sp. H1_B04]